VSADRQNFSSIFGLLNSSSKANPEYLKYRTMFLPKHAAKAVLRLEKLALLRNALDPRQQKTVDVIDGMFTKALLATTSIKGYTTSMLVTNKSEIRISDPRAKRQVLGNIMNPRGQSNEFQ